jgi:hypothetical protein
VGKIMGRKETKAQASEIAREIYPLSGHSLRQRLIRDRSPPFATLAPAAFLFSSHTANICPAGAPASNNRHISAACAA